MMSLLGTKKETQRLIEKGDTVLSPLKESRSQRHKKDLARDETPLYRRILAPRQNKSSQQQEARVPLAKTATNKTDAPKIQKAPSITFKSVCKIYMLY